MKKVIALLLAFVVAAGAFALDLGNGLSIIGEVKTGLRAQTIDDGIDDNEDTRIDPWNADLGGVFRARTTFAYDVDQGGAKIRFQSDGGDFFVKYAYGWFNLMDKQIRLSAGNIGDDVWGQGKIQNVFDPSFDAVTGVRAQFTFVDGLDFGLALPLAQVEYPDDSGSGHKDWPLVGEFLGGAIIGGVYTSDAFKVAATLKLIPGINSEKRTGVELVNVDDPTKGYVDIIGGVEVPLGDLTASVNVRFDGRKIEDHNANGYTRIGPKVVFKTGAITAHAQGDIWLPADSDFEADGSPKTENSVDQDASSTAIAFRVGGEYAVNEKINAYAQVGSDNVSYMDFHGLYIKPGIKFDFSPVGSIEIFDKITKIGADEDIGGKIANQFQIDFNLSF